MRSSSPKFLSACVTAAAVIGAAAAMPVQAGDGGRLNDYHQEKYQHLGLDSSLVGSLLFNSRSDYRQFSWSSSESLTTQASRYLSERAYVDEQGQWHGVTTRMGFAKNAGGRHYEFASINGDHETHWQMGATLGSFTLGYVQGASDARSDANTLFSGMPANFFHGMGDSAYTYQGAAVLLDVAKHGMFLAGSTRVRAEAVEDRSGQFVGLGWKGLSANLIQIDRGAESVGRGFDVRYQFGASQLGLQQIETEQGASLYRFSWQHRTKKRTAIQMDFESGRNALYEDAEDTRVMLRFRTAWGGPSPAFQADESVEGAEEAKPTSRVGLAVGAATAVGIVAASSSSGNDTSDNALRFNLQHDAGFDALKKVNPRSVRENREYGGVIYRFPDGSFSYTGPIKGDIASVNIGGPESVPGGTFATASYHTHGGPDPRYINEQFSTQDINLSNFYGWDAYLGTPGGTFQFYDVDTRRVSILGTLPIQ